MTDKEQQEQDCRECMKALGRGIMAYWLEIMLGIIAVVIIPLAAGKWWDCLVGDDGSGYAIRTLVFAYGAIGAFYGLILAARRLRISEAGLFNDRLGRGVEALDSDKPYIRAAGVRILENLHKTAEPADQKLIISLLSDFIRDKADKYDSE